MGLAQSALCDECGKPEDEHTVYADRTQLSKDRGKIHEMARGLVTDRDHGIETEAGDALFREGSVIAVNVAYDTCDERYAVLEICLVGGVVVTKIVPLENGTKGAATISKKND